MVFGVWPRTRPAVPVAASLCALLAATGCGSSGTSGASPSPSHSAGPFPPRGGGSANVVRCLADHLKVSLGQSRTEGGSAYTSLVFTNTGGYPCTLAGFPSVAPLDPSGKLIGNQASHVGAAGQVLLPPGGSAHSDLHTIKPGGTHPSCAPPAHTLRVLPPGLTNPFTTPASALTTCGGVFQATAVQPGSHS